MQRPNRFHSAGYTLFEIMLVLGIITVILGSAIYMMSGNSGFRENAANRR